MIFFVGSRGLNMIQRRWGVFLIYLFIFDVIQKALSYLFIFDVRLVFVDLTITSRLLKMILTDWLWGSF